MKVKGQALKDETILEIGRFTILWNCFERDWCNNHCNPQTIKNKALSFKVDKETQANLAKVLNQRSYLFGQLKMDYVKSSLHPERARSSSPEDMQAMCQFLEQHGNDKVYGCFLVIYRIRNNLMHGLKSLQELDGQIELFRAANDVLESLR